MPNNISIVRHDFYVNNTVPDIGTVLFFGKAILGRRPIIQMAIKGHGIKTSAHRYAQHDSFDRIYTMPRFSSS